MVKIQEVSTADTCTDSEPLEQVQNDVRYNVFANDLQHSEQSESVSNTCLVKTNDSNVIPDSHDMCDDDIQNDQNDVESDDERVALANLIANLKLDNKQTEFEKYKAFNDRTVDYDKLEEIADNAWVKQSKDQFRAPTAQDMEILIQTCLIPLAIKTQYDSFLFVHELKQEMHANLKYVESLEKEIDELESDKAEFSNMYDMILQECIPKPSVLGKPAPFSNSLERRYFPKTKLVLKTNVSEGLSKLVTTQTLPQIARQAVSNINVLKPGMYRIDNMSTQTRAPQSLQTIRNTNPRVSSSTRVIHKTNVSRPHHKSNQLKDKVLPNNSQVKPMKTQVEEHHRISSISNKTKFVTACNDSFNSRTLNANAVCATWFITSKASIPISSQLVNFVMRIWRLSHLNFDYINLLSKKDIMVGLPKLKYVKDQLCSSYELSKAKRSSFKSKVVPSSKGRLNLLHMELCVPMRVASVNGKNYILVIVDDYSRYTWTFFLHAHVPSQQELDLLFGPLYDEFFNTEEEHLPDDEFTNPFCAPTQEVAESSSHNIVNSNVPTFNQPQEEVYVAQPNRFVNPDHPEKVYRLKKALYGLKQTPKAWTLDPPIPMWYLYQSGQGSSFGLTAFSDVDHAGCIDSRKNTSRGIQFLGDKLVSWMSKKQNFTTMSSAEAEYVVLSASCVQVM
uniref:Retrotransposon protein, putative, unclassified n=1 Tax=Tanacetum cinerariifolium TaxID=118510 RepID=A0A699H3H7_TANCI|nr:retrotransposon protein, putative, unclassified [Tanacetum cinerariifolium]